MGRRSQPTKAEDIMEALRLLRFLNPVYESSQLSELKLHLVHDYTDCSVLLARLLSEHSVEMASPEAYLKSMMLLNKYLGKAPPPALLWVGDRAQVCVRSDANSNGL